MTSSMDRPICPWEDDCGRVAPKLSARQQAELIRMHGTGGYTIAELMEVFSVGRATVYRVLERATVSPTARVEGASPTS
jgi:DNA invertase Pin-like site-specific DNA recombinase